MKPYPESEMQQIVCGSFLKKTPSLFPGIAVIAPGTTLDLFQPYS
jgi:hypothetical protein